jgi:hypothetical protein
MREAATYQQVLETSKRANWRIDDLVGERFDFSRCFLPETFVQAEALAWLTPGEKLLLNHIRSRGYLAMFELLEQVIVPFMSDQAKTAGGEDPYEAPALRNLVREENKHRELFRRCLADFDAEFGAECAVIGPAEAIVEAILAHEPMAVTIAILALEWMSQGHYIESIAGDESLDPRFRTLLQRHWEEEAQHAALDEMLLREQAAAAPDGIEAAVKDFFAIGVFLDGGLKQQAELDLAAFERAAGRALSAEQRAEFLEVQHQALRWTFLGTTLSNPNFLAIMDDLAPDGGRPFREAAPVFSLN